MADGHEIHRGAPVGTSDKQGGCGHNIMPTAFCADREQADKCLMGDIVQAVSQRQLLFSGWSISQLWSPRVLDAGMHDNLGKAYLQRQILRMGFVGRFLPDIVNEYTTGRKDVHSSGLLALKCSADIDTIL